MENTLEPAVEEQYRDALKAVRRELRQSGHTIDGRASVQHQPRTLFAGLSDLFPEESLCFPIDDGDLAGISGAEPVEDGIQELSDPYPQVVGQPRRICASDLFHFAKGTKLELPMLRNNSEQEVREMFRNISIESRPNPLYTTTLVAEALEDGPDEFDALYQSLRHFENILKTESEDIFQNYPEAQEVAGPVKRGPHGRFSDLHQTQSKQVCNNTAGQDRTMVTDHPTRLTRTSPRHFCLRVLRRLARQSKQCQVFLSRHRQPRGLTETARPSNKKYFRLKESR